MNDKTDIIVEIQKFNPFHDSYGKFSSAQGMKSYSANPKTRAGQLAIARSSRNHGEVKNIHTNSAGRTIAQNHKYITTGEGTPAPSKVTTKPKTTTKPKEEPKKEPQEEKQQQTKVQGTYGEVNLKTQKGHQQYDEGKSYENMDSSEIVDNVAMTTGVDRSTAKAMASSVWDFSDGEYSAIRGASRGDAKYSDYKEDADNIENFIEKSPKWGADSGPLYRGLGLEREEANKLIADAEAGKPLDQRGISSWSSSRSTAESFASNGQDEVILVNKSGTRYGTSIKHLSEYASENEVITSAKQKVVATDIQKTHKDNIMGGYNVYVITVKEID